MDKHSKTYTKSRIEEIAKGACEKLSTVSKPKLGEHIRAAIINGTARPLNNTDLLTNAQESIMANGYGREYTTFSKVFKQPKTYISALKLYEDDQERVEGVRQEIVSRMGEIIDRVMLGQFEYGMNAIAEMNEFIKATVNG